MLITSHYTQPDPKRRPRNVYHAVGQINDQSLAVILEPKITGGPERAEH